MSDDKKDDDGIERALGTGAKEEYDTPEEAEAAARLAGQPVSSTPTKEPEVPEVPKGAPPAPVGSSAPAAPAAPAPSAPSVP